MRVVVIASIEQVVVAILLTAGNGHRTCAGVIVGGGNTGGRTRRNGSSAGEQDQISSLPPVQRQIHDPALVHDLGDGSVLCLDHSGIGGHLNLLVYRPHLHGDVDQDIVRHLEDNAGLDKGAEIRSRNL